MLISIDTLRADRLSCYGYERETSPVIDSIAADGVRFDSHSDTEVLLHGLGDLDEALAAFRKVGTKLGLI